MLIPILTMSIMGLLFGLGLAYASKIFRVEIDPKIDMIMRALPGANCGACGMAGCASLAEAIAHGKAEITSCAPGGQEVCDKIAGILGVGAKVKHKKTARVRCNGGKRSADKYIYQGVKKCYAATLLAGGNKECRFGCLGFGDCVGVCSFDAIHLNENNIPVVSADKCTACGKCVHACPRKIIILEKTNDKIYVKCLSRDKGTAVKPICPVGCIGCKICEKLSGGVFIVENNLSRADYSKAKSDTPWQTVIEKCPVKCIVSDN
ncbi:MAG: RnfABCDGE type electron transport complex subunit B [Candidatus Omnitrophota bacterium]|nr:RnfABCDGE type electron transport complex subunit B [Candidatus Omnitrophota bacterium]